MRNMCDVCTRFMKYGVVPVPQECHPEHEIRLALPSDPRYTRIVATTTAFRRDLDMANSRWDDEYDSYQDDQNHSISVDPTSDDLWYQDARYDA